MEPLITVSPANYSAIVFDLGGVLYKIDPPAFQNAIRELADRCGGSFDIKNMNSFVDLSHSYECGIINTQVFRDRAIKKFFPRASNHDFDQAWNSMLIGLYENRTSFIRNLSESYKLYLLSNTNPLHFNALYFECEEMFSYFERLYVSYELNSRKPEPTIYKTMLKVAGLKANELLFIDDSNDNVNGAKSIGIDSLLLTDPTKLESIFISN